MSTKASPLYSIFSLKCPRCHEGDLFPKGTMFKPSRFSEMHANCPCCGQSFEPEPGYYYGAMFVSYALSTAIFIGVWLVLTLLVVEVTLLMMVGVILAVVIGLMPINFRLSRSLWIHIFVRYEGPCASIPKKA